MSIASSDKKENGRILRMNSLGGIIYYPQKICLDGATPLSNIFRYG